MTHKAQDSTVENVRMGPLALFTLMAVLCLAVLAVLAVSTANATLTLSQRRADATSQLYYDERAAQAFVAALDAELAGDGSPGQALAAARDAALALTPGPADGAVGPLEVSCSHSARSYDASFDCGNGRRLDLSLHEGANGTLEVQRWRFTAVVNDEPTMGDLFGGF